MSKILKADNDKTSISDCDRLSRLAAIVFNRDKLCIELSLNNVWWWKHQYDTVEEYDAVDKKTRKFIAALREAFTDGTHHFTLLSDSGENFSAMAILGCEQIIRPNKYRMGSDIKFKEDEIVQELVNSLVASKQ